MFSRKMNRSKLGVLIFGLGFIFFATKTITAEADDGVRLMAFKKSSVDSDPNGFLTDWTLSSSSSSPCPWRGVLCSDDGRVTSLNITNSGLTGRLDLSDLMAIPTLTHLHFSHNFFYGDLSFTSPSCPFQTLDLSFNNFTQSPVVKPLLHTCDRLLSLSLSSNGLTDSSLLSTISLSNNCNSLNMLNFSNNKLTGNLPTSLSSCKNLSSLDLSNNLFSGEIPTHFPISPALSFLDLSHNNFTGKFQTLVFQTCQNLTELNLSHNGLFGTGFPVSLSNCQILERLDVSYNVLRMKIPGNFLGNFKNLKKLSLSRNQFFGQIPPELGNACRTLQELDLSGNQLTEGLPTSFASCSSLFNLNLGHNYLSGEFLTTVVSSLSSLKYLYVPFNNITGNLPLSLANCTQLQVLDLSSNEFTGTIPSGFCSSNSPFSALERILLPNNYLYGMVPSELGDCKNLKTIDLSFNSIMGAIPLEIWNLPNILDLVMWANNLTGKIPEGICINGGNLQTLILNNNVITGTIPRSIVNCTNLIWVSLSSNRITGDIPEGIESLSNLAILQLGNNSLTGEIPLGLGNCKNLVWLDLNSNGLSGTIPKELANGAGLVLPRPVSGKQFAFVRNEFGTSCRGAGGLVEFEGIQVDRLAHFPMVHSCPSTRIYTGVTVYTFERNGSMIYLDLSFNYLSGIIPETFGSMSFLQVLNLGHNNLTGNIPFSFGDLKGVGVLDVSHNNLQGFIPGSLGGLSFLTDLDLSNNNLTGPIPSGGQLTTFPPSRYENNTGLCGLPLTPCSSSGNGRAGFHNQGNKKRNSLTAGVVVGITVSLVFVTMLTLVLIRMMKTYQRKEEEREKYIESLPTSGSSSWKLSSVPEPLSINIATFEKPLRKLTFGHLLEATNGFSADSLIGSGGFGDVYRAQLKDGPVVAIKKLIHITSQGDREFMAEMETIGKIKHRNLVPLLGYCKIGEERLLVYEYMKWGSLESVLHERAKSVPKLDWASRKKIAIGSARGLAFLHHSCLPHIIHRDMKSSNVLLDEGFEARVSDFGMARLVNALDTHLSVSTLAGTPGYVPPEYYQSFRCTAKGDVYSYGVVLLELLSGKRPIDPVEYGDDNNLVGWAKQLQREKRIYEILDPELLSNKSCEAELFHYLKISFQCVDDKSWRRPTMIQVMTMFKELQEDSGSDILDKLSMKSSVIDESQEKEHSG